jgi:hypothetical protein
MVLLIEAIRAAVAWWQGELAQPDWGDIALIACCRCWSGSGGATSRPSAAPTVPNALPPGEPEVRS